MPVEDPASRRAFGSDLAKVDRRASGPGWQTRMAEKLTRLAPK